MRESVSFADKWWKTQGRGFDDMVKNDDKFIQFLQQNFSWSYPTACKHMDTIRRMYFPNLDQTPTSEQIEDNLASVSAPALYPEYWRKIIVAQ